MRVTCRIRPTPEISIFFTRTKTYFLGRIFYKLTFNHTCYGCIDQFVSSSSHRILLLSFDLSPPSVNFTYDLFWFFICFLQFYWHDLFILPMDVILGICLESAINPMKWNSMSDWYDIVHFTMIFEKQICDDYTIRSICIKVSRKEISSFFVNHCLKSHYLSGIYILEIIKLYNTKYNDNSSTRCDT